MYRIHNIIFISTINQKYIEHNIYIKYDKTDGMKYNNFLINVDKLE